MCRNTPYMCVEIRHISSHAQRHTSPLHNMIAQEHKEPRTEYAAWKPTYTQKYQNSPAYVLTYTVGLSGTVLEHVLGMLNGWDLCDLTMRVCRGWRDASIRTLRRSGNVSPARTRWRIWACGLSVASVSVASMSVILQAPWLDHPQVVTHACIHTQAHGEDLQDT